MTASAQESAVADAGTDAGVGARLRRARESANLSVGEVASRLHLDGRTVAALEHDEYEVLPAPAFVRGYLRGYARLLGLPPDPIMEAFDRHGLAPPTLLADIAEKPQARSTDFPVRIATYLIVAGLATLVVLWWQSRHFVPTPTDVSGTTVPLPAADPTLATPGGDVAAAPQDTLAAPEPDPLSAPSPGAGEFEISSTLDGPYGPSVATDDAPAESGEFAPPREGVLVDGGPAADALELAAAAAEPFDVPSPAATLSPTPVPADDAPLPTADAPGPVVDAPDALASVAPTIADPQPARESAPGSSEPGSAGAGGSVLSLAFAHESWVEIYDRDEQQRHFGLVQPGAEIEIRGRAPLRVLLGNAKDVEVIFDGVRFDYTPFLSRGIARFTLGGSAPAAAADAPADAPAEPEPAPTGDTATSSGGADRW